jgi:hypothetical protein
MSCTFLHFMGSEKAVRLLNVVVNSVSFCGCPAAGVWFAVLPSGGPGSERQERLRAAGQAPERSAALSSSVSGSGFIESGSGSSILG